MRTLESFETYNRKLRELLDSSDKLESLKVTRKDTSWGNVFETIRKHAIDLHTAVKRSWRCDCSTPHQGDLHLQCRNSTSDEPVTFHMASDVPAPTNSAIISRREVMIKLRKKEDASSRTPSPSIASQASSTDYLRRNFEHKSSSQLSVISRPILTTSISDLSNTSSQSSFLDVFSRSTSGQSTMTSVSCASTTGTVTTSSRYLIPVNLQSLRGD